MRTAVNPAYTAYVPPGGPVPAAPSQVTSVTVDAGATVSWVNPGSGPAATSYTVTPYIAGTPQAAATVTAPAASATLTGLTNSTAYTFSVHASNGAGRSPESAQSGANTPFANLVFGDDFNGSFLDPHWSVLTRDGDQSNTELHYYLPGNVSLDGSSNLVIVAKAQPVTLPGYNDANPPTYAGTNVTRSYTSGCVQWASFSLNTGKVQVSAKAANGNNLWPAIWMLGGNCQVQNPLDPDNVGTCNWHATGSEEIDIAEFQGSAAQFNTEMFYNGGTSGQQFNTVTSADTTYHTYETDWSAGTLTWKLDGTTVETTTTGVPSTPMFLLLQTAIRGGTPTFTQPNLIVDWVRVYHN